MLIIKETSERNDDSNWVKKRLNHDGFISLEFEGYTINNKNEVSGLFDRRNYEGFTLKEKTCDEIVKIIKEQEPFLNAKLQFASMMSTYYRYVFYSYQQNLLTVFRLNHNSRIIQSKEYNDFCDFINDTKIIRGYVMSSCYEESGLPQIDKYFREKCKIPWMGNLDGLFLSSFSGKPKALIEFQTTTKVLVREHSNNKWFLPTARRKGDEQRWLMFDILAKSAKLPIIIIVWSPKEVNGDIKFKQVKKFTYSTDPGSEKPGIYYTRNEIVDFNKLKLLLRDLVNPRVGLPS